MMDDDAVVSDKSILAYLSQTCPPAHDAFLSSLQAASPSFTAPDASFNDALEKKWTSLVRLSKRVLELEAENTQLKADVEEASKGGARLKADLSLSLPREPAKHVLKGHRDAVKRVRFHPVFALLVSASEDATIKVWDPESGSLERTLQGHQDSVNDIDFSSSGNLLASCSSDLSIKLWSFESDEYTCLRTLHGHNHAVSAVAFLPSGEQLLSASRDKSIKQWDCSTGYCTRTFNGHENWVRCIAIHPNGTLFASGSMDQHIKLWTIKTGEQQRTLRDHEHVVEAVIFSTALADGFIDAWRKENNGSVTPSIQNGVTSAFSSSATSSIASTTTAPTGTGGHYLASASRDRTIRIYEVASGVCIHTIVAHENWISGLIFHPSGRFLISCSDDKSIRVFDITKNWKQIKKLSDAHDSFVSCIGWNRGQPMLASGGVDNTIKVWTCK